MGLPRQDVCAGLTCAPLSFTPSPTKSTEKSLVRYNPVLRLEELRPGKAKVFNKGLKCLLAPFELTPSLAE